MKPDVKQRYIDLKKDFTKSKGQPFDFFFCPILFVDENVELCKAHILNKAFSNTARLWTIQRKDVDNFYGSPLEAKFLAIEFRDKSSLEILSEKKLSNIFKPKILFGSDEIEHYIPQNTPPESHTLIQLHDEQKQVTLALKIEPQEFLQAVGRDLHISTANDLSTSAIASLIKAAHLTLFELLGYEYALRDGGKFIGRNILGEFFIQNLNNKKDAILSNAETFFAQYRNMVRPVEINELEFEGTITDHLFLVCKHTNFYWAMVVFLKVSQTLHAVIVPVFDDERAKPKFQEFLDGKVDKIEVSVGEIAKEHFKVHPQFSQIKWPAIT